MSSLTTNTTNLEAILESAKSLTDAPSEVELATPTIVVGDGGQIIAKLVQEAGFVSGGERSAYHYLSTQGTQTIIPTTTDQTIPDEVYITGVQTIKGDANLVPENIASGVSIFGVEGTMETETVVSGSGADAVVAITAAILSGVDESYYFTEYLPLKTGMTWKECYESSFFGFISCFSDINNIPYSRIDDEGGDYTYPPSFRHLYWGSVLSLTTSNICYADGTVVGWDDVIQPYNVDDASTIYTCV